MSSIKKSCKICHMGETKGDKLCNPCKCSGTIKYIHKECLLSWMSCSKTEKCDICHYEYKFKDVYKPNTPRVLPFSILIKGVIDIGYRAFVVLAWYFLQIIKWVGVFYLNGCFLLLSTGLCSRDVIFTFNYTFVCLISGVPLTWLAQVHQCLFSQVQKKFGDSTRRRRIVIDSRAVLESMDRGQSEVSDAVHTHQGSETEERSSGIYEESRSTSRRMETNERKSDDGQLSEFQMAGDFSDPTSSKEPVSGNVSVQEESRGEGSEEQMSEDSNVSLSRENVEFTGFESAGGRESVDSIVDFSPRHMISGIFGLTAPIMFLPVIYMISRIIPIHIPYPSFNMFLEKMDLRYIYSRLIAFGVVFWLTIQGLSYAQRKINSRNLKFVRIFLKIYYIIILNVFFMYLTFGLVIHYMFGNILNGGVYVLDLKDSYNILIRGFVSLALHMSIGYTLSMMIRNVCLKFKKCFRPGLLHFVPDDEDSKMDELYEASKAKTFEIILRVAIYLLIFSVFYGTGFAAVWYLCNGINVRLSIRSLLKLSLICKVFSVLLYSNDILGDYVVPGLNKMVRLQSKLLGMENFLYNTPMKEYDRRRLMWCANKNKVFRRQHIRAREKKIPTNREILKHFSKNSSADFAIFYIPSMFALRCLFILLNLITLCYCFYAGYVSAAKFISSRINIQEYFPSSEDVVFYLILAGLLRMSWILMHIIARVSEKKSFLKVIGELTKYGIVNIYVNLLYPLFGSFILIILSNDTLSFNTLRPLRLFLLFFSNTFIVETLVCGYILRSSPEYYSFRTLVRELYKINAFISVLFGVWYLYNAVTLILGLSNIEFIVLGVFVGYAVFITKKINQSIGGDKSFYRRLLDENYLVERRVINMDEEE